jgi:general secretion pathway protein D
VGGAAVAAPEAAVQNGGNSDIPPQAARAPSLAPPVQIPRGVSGDDGGFSSPGFALPPGGANAGGISNGSGNGNTAAAIASSIGSLPVQAGVGPIVKFVADTRNNTVMIYSSYSMYKTVRERLRVLDVPQAQVVIEAMVAEVTLNDDLSRGVEAFLSAKGLDISSSAGGAKSTKAGGGFLDAQFGIQGATAEIIIHALQSVTNVKVISTPYLTVVDGKTARLVIGDQIPFSTTTQSSTSTIATVTQQITIKDTGIQLEVTPKIRADNSAALNINQSVSAVKDTATASSLNPTISTRSVKSDVIVQSGSTIMLAGLVEERSNRIETGVPVARSIPIVGELFKQNEDIASRQELIVLITPRVIRNSSQLENITRQMRGMMHIRG